jgi:hypothetical protein
MVSRYRALGADLPFGDPTRAHGVAMEGYFWRLSDPGSGRVIVALCGVHRGRAGRPWANVALAAHPGKVVRAADLTTGVADPDRLGVQAGDGAFVADARRVRLDLGADASLDLRLDDVHGWTRRALGGLGVGQVVPGLSQHWHPHVLGARASGTARIDGEEIDLGGFRVYAEKNWGREGFPDRWWWGQAGCFPDGVDACVAFAGGSVRLGPLTTTATAVVVRVGETLVRLGDPVLSPAHVTTGDGRWHVRARGPRYSVEIEARADPASAHVLPVPLPARGYSVAGALQHFAGVLHVVLRRRGRIVFAGESTLAGLERGGVNDLAGELARRRETPA